MSKAFSQSCENNKQPILEILSRQFADRKTVLEIGSGTGQHAVFFAGQLPHLHWQTSDLPQSHSSINAWIDDSQLSNVKRPVELDVNQTNWPVQAFDAVFSANTCHIMAWSSVQNFFAGLGENLCSKGKCCIYGPFNYNGQYSNDSNAQFDIWLKERGAHQGIRDFEAVAELAIQAQLTLIEDNPMPANNRLLVWQKV